MSTTVEVRTLLRALANEYDGWSSHVTGDAHGRPVVVVCDPDGRIPAPRPGT